MAEFDGSKPNNQIGFPDIQPPQLSLPKGGGAIRGIGEKFAANSITGAGSLSVPIATSPGRAGFGPQLVLSYDSGAGNGPFGFGWSLALPAITRKTDKGLPQYHDEQASDVFLLSGAEDLVPEFKKDAAGAWVVKDGARQIREESRAVGSATYRIRRYRPRIEGLFARIECWTRDDGDVHWRSFSKDNILTLYGQDANSRIADPADPHRIFSWLICESRDDKGNAVLFEYQPEDGAGVDLTAAHERNRGAADDARRAVNRYPKRIHYGNRLSLLDAAGQRPPFLSSQQRQGASWMFEVVFDYDEGHLFNESTDADEQTFVEASAAAAKPWRRRVDPFSTYRAGFEVRTTRRCDRVLMFHHFEGEPDIGPNCLVRSTDFTYNEPEDPTIVGNPVYTFLRAVTQSGYARRNGVYLKRALPPVGFQYTEPIVQDRVEEIDAESLENLPVGLDGAAYQWTDLHGEGVPGILTEQANAWFYTRNLSPIGDGPVAFAAVELVAAKPSLGLAGGRAQLMDLAGDGRPDLVALDGPIAGFYEHDEAEGWEDFRPFPSRLHRDTRDPNLKFVDLDGDGRADMLATEADAFIWHRSLGEEGFEPARRVSQALDEEQGLRLIFADATQSIHLADLSGDGLTDLVRIRNGEACYWPNLGYGRFGAKIAMDNAPWFDRPDQFDPKRIRLADIDGAGPTDIVYHHRDGVVLYFNQSGNSWSAPRPLRVSPPVNDLVAMAAIDLKGNGTTCLVWSSPLPGDARRQMRYVDLMGGTKPHLLIGVANNLGAETRVAYASSAKFYLQDKRDGKPWITRLPFPVHVVERVETYDYISRNRFVTRYAYHHGYFDGEEREFRGFGLIEQRDTEESAALAGEGFFPSAANVDATSFSPAMLTKTWFHTGVYVGREHVSDFYAGSLDAADAGEYYREPGLTDAQAQAMLLADTPLPGDLTLDEEREACRALKGSMLRQEVYALDGTDKEPRPYTVTQQNFTVRLLQPQGGNRHGVFFTHPREALTYHYERALTPVLNGQIVDEATAASNPAVQWSPDPRLAHALTLDVDLFGNVLRSASVGYGRRYPDLRLPLDGDRDRQLTTLVTYSENLTTRSFETGQEVIDTADDYRTPLLWDARAYEVTGFALPAGRDRFTFDEISTTGTTAAPIAYEAAPAAGALEKRLIEQTRTGYRRNDLTGPLPLGTLQSLALPFQSYRLAFTPGLIAGAFGGRVTEPMIQDEGGYRHSGGDANWWISSGQVFYSATAADTPAQELAEARARFFRPRRFRDPFDAERIVTYDPYDLLVVDISDPVGNRVTAGERLPDDSLDGGKPGNDYRVLQPRRLMDPNRNRIEVAFDALGLVVGTAMMGKPPPAPVEGDSLDGFAPDLTQAQIDAVYEAGDPRLPAATILADATTRVIYDLDRFQRTRAAHPNDPAQWLPAYAATVARETHAAAPPDEGGLRVQVSFAYSDGFGRVIQKKVRAEPGPVIDGGPVVDPRWVGSGWTIFNNKGNPVRQYEPFFSRLAETRHRFEFGAEVGVSPILFYDPAQRVVATLHPNHAYEKALFDPWRQASYDVNDTVSLEPQADDDLKGYFLRPDGAPRLPETDYLPSWRALRTDPAHAAEAAQRWPDARTRAAEAAAAQKAADHALTPTVVHVDALGRAFLTLADNGLDPAQPTQHLLFAARVDLDIEGNQRAVRDAVVQNGDRAGRIVMRYDYDLLGNRIHQASMEAGERWMLNDVAGKPMRAWDSRGHAVRTEYDALRRPLRLSVVGADPANPAQELLTERMVYGEQHPEEERNLRGRLFLHLDQSGAALDERCDFKGNLKLVSRRLTSGAQYRQAVDWRTVDDDHAALPPDPAATLDLAALTAALAPRLDAEVFTNRTEHDALNRPVAVETPDATTIRLAYNEAGLLQALDANLRGARQGDQPVWTTFVANIDYDARGQRTQIDYGNGARTTYAYDPETFRFVQLLTRRHPAAFPADCPEPAPAGWPGCQVQHLHYAYDPFGNITAIRDEAQQTVYFRNKRVEPSADYTYDAIYRLIEAGGREHLGQVGGAPIPHSPADAPRVGLPHPGDGDAMGSYVERYGYDAAGNMREMRHLGTDPVNSGWTRIFAYDETSLIEDGAGGDAAKTSNRLSNSSVAAGANPLTERYVYDAHGNMIRMPYLGGTHPAPNMRWDYRDQLRQVDLQGGGTAYYVYDAAGQRVRKIWEKAPGLVEERIYLGGCEIFRRRNGGGAVTLERQTLHVMDDKERIALVETRTQGDDPAPQQLIRYQFGNHLGSACLELDDQAQIISYEEYSPYGSTTYQAVRSQTETPKRYRYTNKERDEETGLGYHRARYYAPWLGRWASADPVGLGGGSNLYIYCRSSPVAYRDPHGTDEEPGQNDPSKRVATDAARLGAGLLNLVGNRLNFTAMGQGLRKVKLALNIDEIQAVSGGGSWGSAANKQFLDSLTNQFTKNAGVATHQIPARSQISLAEELAKGSEQFRRAASELMTRRFSEVKELESITNDAVAAIKNPTRTARALANAVNKSIRGRIAREASEDAKLVAQALRESGFDPKTLTAVKQEAALAGAATADVAKGGEAIGLLAKAAPIIGKVMRATAPATKVLGKVATPLAFVGAGVQFATAKTTDDYIDASISTTSASLMAMPHPVAKAGGAGLAAGQMIDHALNVSDYSSAAGVKVYETLKDAGLNDTASYVIGGVASVVAIPGAIGYGAAAKVASWFK